MCSRQAAARLDVSWSDFLIRRTCSAKAKSEIGYLTVIMENEAKKMLKEKRSCVEGNISKKTASAIS